MCVAMPCTAADVLKATPAPPVPIGDKYPGDVGIAKDRRVLLAEDFESGRFDRKKWTNISNKAEALSFSKEVPKASRGTKSLLVTARLGQNTGGHLFRRLKTGVDRMHARFYVRFAEDCDYIHHFVHIVAEDTEAPWPTGGAGLLPAGDKKFSTGLEPWGKWNRYRPPGAWNFYSYWWKMKRAPDGKYWGNSFAPKEPAQVRRGRWYCMEMMVQANTPGKADGRQAFWVDGKLVGDFAGIQWRKVAELKINAFWLMSYITSHSAKTNRVNRVWFDDLVVATDYVGPIAGGKPDADSEKKGGPLKESGEGGKSANSETD